MSVNQPAQVRDPGSSRMVRVLLGLLLLAALLVRLDQLTERTFGHPENFVTGLNVPEWVKYPPPRNDLEGIYRGTLIDGHPPGYFVAMLPWVKTFGSSLLALRLPSVILGVFSIWLLFAFARRETDDWTALGAAALLAFNGHHVFWSQQARMYALATALGLVSALLLYKILIDNRREYRVAYFATLTAMLWTQLYCWPLLLAQMVWVTMHGLRSGRLPTVLKIQFAAVIAATPVIQLSIYQNPPTQWQQSALEYFGFGYMYYSESLFFGARHPFAAVSIPLSVLGIGLLLLGVRAHSNARVRTAENTTDSASAFSTDMVVIATLATALLVAFPLTAPAARTGRAVLLAVSLLPSFLLLTLATVQRVWSHPRVQGWRWPQRLPRPLSVWLAILPWSIMYGLSVLRPSFVARGALIFVPYLLLVIAVAIASLRRQRPALIAAVATVVVLLAGSVIYFRNVESSGRDYASLAEGLKRRLQPNDVVLVRNRFTHPPLLYYLPEHLEQVVPMEALRDRSLSPDRRVWVIDFEEPADSNLYRLVRGRAERESVEAFGGRAVLFAPLTN